MAEWIVSEVVAVVKEMVFHPSLHQAFRMERFYVWKTTSFPLPASGVKIPRKTEKIMKFINQYSFLLIALGIILAFAIYFLRNGVESGNLVALAALTLGFVIAFVLLSPTASNADTLDEVMVKTFPLKVIKDEVGKLSW